ncbi:hypothetical protein GCM10009119_36300 [Algoriphagus jejuensis]|uniref:Outer membrane protein with beta-barrel domain n=1 Tax=Algoriphagus jejuensis TaxID=419934 RepID=A0ABP3YGS8_9BACT
MKSLVQHISALFLLFCAGNVASQSFYQERISRDNILSIGLGPSFAYLDNGGQYKELNFEIKPSISVALTRKLNPTFDLRTSLGYQYISSGGNPSPDVIEDWIENSASFTAKGPVYYFDVMPSMYIIKFSNHMHRSLFNLYGGFGLGVMHSRTEQTKSFDSEEVPTKYEITTGYIPARAGLTYRLGPYSDIAGEGTMMWTFTDNLDGNEGFNKFGDVLYQFQVVYRHYFVVKNND